MKKIALSIFAFCFVCISFSTGYAMEYAEGYQGKWVKQTQAETENQYFYVKPGDIVEFVATFKNVGKKTWRRTGEEQVTFAIYKDPHVQSAPRWTGYDDSYQPLLFGKSYFEHSTWVSQYRVGGLSEEEVAPGEVGNFFLYFKIPDNARRGSYREDISLAAGPKWMKADAPYPKGTGDPLGVAHIWVGFVITEDAEGLSLKDNEVNDAMYTTATRVKRATIRQKYEISSLGDLAAYDLTNNALLLGERLKSLLFQSILAGIQGKFDLDKENAEFSFQINLNLNVNGVDLKNKLGVSVVILNGFDTVYFRLDDIEAPIIDFISSDDSLNDFLDVMADLKGQWIVFKDGIDFKAEDSRGIFGFESELAEYFYRENRVLQFIEELDLKIIDGKVVKGYRVYYREDVGALFITFMSQSKNFLSFLGIGASSVSSDAVFANQENQSTYDFFSNVPYSIWVDDNNFVRASEMELSVPLFPPNSSQNFSLLIKMSSALSDINNYSATSVRKPSKALTEKDVSAIIHNWATSIIRPSKVLTEEDLALPPIKNTRRN